MALVRIQGHVPQVPALKVGHLPISRTGEVKDPGSALGGKEAGLTQKLSRAGGMAQVVECLLTKEWSTWYTLLPIGHG
jgi:hypothetical protein